MSNIIRRVWNQNKMVQIEALTGMIFQAEAGGHTFEISGVDSAGNAVPLSGTVSGVFLRADNTDVALTGSASGGVVSVNLRAECYAVPGRFGLTIYVTSGGQKTAVYAAVGTASRTTSGNVSPAVTADVVDLVNRIAAATNSIPATYTNLLADIAPTYSDSAVYAVGQFAWYNGDLKRCKTAITTPETFTAAHWENGVLGNDLNADITDLKSALNWICQGKNLCGLDPNVYYPVHLADGEYLTLSTADESNCGYSGMYLYVYDANKTQLNYYTFPSDSSERTIKLSSDYDVRYMRWSRDIHKNLQVEVGETKTAYEPYWGNAFVLSQKINSISNDINELHGNYNNIRNIEDNKYLQNTSGRVFDNDAYRTSDYIAITPGNTYKLGLFNQNNAPSFECNAITVCFYDANTIVLADTYVYASGFEHTRCDWDGGFVKFIAPNNAYFIRIGVNDSASPLKWFVADYSASDLFADINEIKSQIVTDNTALQGKRIAVFGDSIMGNTRDTTSTPAYISKASGATVFNFGFGGCRMSVHASGWDNCSMYRLADDIYNNDFTSLVSAINTGWSGMPGYYKNTVAWLSACDFSKVDAIIIAYGTNDYREPSSTLDNPNNKFDTSTVCGALRYSIKQILSKYPGVQILVTCPIFRTFFQDGTTTPESYSDTKDWGSGTLLQYAEAYKQACADMNVPFLDLYHETSFNPFTRLYFYPADDGTHPNENGRERIGNIIGGKLKTLLPNN